MGQNYNITTNSTYTSNLVLNIYVNDAGKVLVTGYADSVSGLSFLKDSQYKYDKDTKQLYALTNSLTYKSGEDWEAKLPSQGNYSEYHSIFYLPASVKISKIDATPGLEYLVSATNDSFQVDLHGYDVKSPTITIDYELPITDSGTPMASNNTTVVSSGSYLMPVSALFGLVAASVAIVLWRRQKRTPLTPKDDRYNGHEIENAKPDNVISEASDSAADGPIALDENPSEMSSDLNAGTADNSLNNDINNNDINNNADIISPDNCPAPDESSSRDNKASETASRAINITSEMAAVMETLTSREKAVLEALIAHNGKMVQADIRYETHIPKSSLTGILLSLERRKLVTKKEMGRVNIIELSEWFLSKKGMQ
ncbi:MAG: helix-turn-helix transcriptional regulator [Methanotrichaceae archaeon]